MSVNLWYIFLAYKMCLRWSSGIVELNHTDRCRIAIFCVDAAEAHSLFSTVAPLLSVLLFGADLQQWNTPLLFNTTEDKFVWLYFCVVLQTPVNMQTILVWKKSPRAKGPFLVVLRCPSASLSAPANRLMGNLPKNYCYTLTDWLLTGWKSVGANKQDKPPKPAKWKAQTAAAQSSSLSSLTSVF